MSKPENELEILEPNQEIEINGETITVNEITFGQSMKLGGLLTPLVDSLSKCYDGQALESDNAISCLYEHEEVSFKMLEMSTGKDKKFIESLTDGDGYFLLVTFFGVHSGFFGRRLLTAMTVKQKKQETIEDLKNPEVDG